jgi:hypothetical protein
MKPFTFSSTQSSSLDNIYQKLKKYHIDIKSWEFNMDILSESEIILYKKATASIIKDNSKHKSAQDCIYSLIYITKELKKEDLNECNHCYKFLVELNQFSKVHDKIFYMALYKKALFTEMAF